LKKHFIIYYIFTNMNKILFAQGTFLVKTGDLLTLINSYQASDDINVTYFMKEIDEKSFPNIYEFLDKYLANIQEIEINDEVINKEVTLVQNSLKKFKGKKVQYIKLSKKEHFLSKEAEKFKDEHFLLDKNKETFIANYQRDHSTDFKNNGDKVPLWFAEIGLETGVGSNIVNLDVSKFDFYRCGFSQVTFNNASHGNQIIQNKAQFIEYLLNDSYKKEVALYNETYKPKNKDQTIGYFAQTLFSQAGFMVIVTK